MNKLSPLRLLLLLLAMLLAGCAAGVEDPLPVAPSTKAPEGAPEEATEDWPAAVIIYLGSQVYDVLPLEENTVTIDQGDGRVNEIAITDSSVVMASATCENQNCVHQGEVTLENYETRVLGTYIMCLPNQVTINLSVREEPAP